MDVSIWAPQRVKHPNPLLSKLITLLLRVSLAFNTIVGTALLMEQISFAFPAALLMYQRRNERYLPQKSRYNLGSAGWVVNSVVVCWTCLVLVMYSFPTMQPVTPRNMSEYSAKTYSPLKNRSVVNLKFADACFSKTTRLHMRRLFWRRRFDHGELDLLFKKPLP